MAGSLGGRGIESRALGAKNSVFTVVLRACSVVKIRLGRGTSRANDDRTGQPWYEPGHDDESPATTKKAVSSRELAHDQQSGAIA